MRTTKPNLHGVKSVKSRLHILTQPLSPAYSLCHVGSVPPNEEGPFGAMQRRHGAANEVLEASLWRNHARKELCHVGISAVRAKQTGLRQGVRANHHLVAILAPLLLAPLRIFDEQSLITMAIVHVVSFKYKDSVSAEQSLELYNQFNTFKSACLYTDGKPYILDFKSSTENTSPENAGKGFHHIFISTFPSQDHVKHYLEKDPVHLAFVVSVCDFGKDGRQQNEDALTLTSLHPYTFDNHRSKLSRRSRTHSSTTLRFKLSFVSVLPCSTRRFNRHGLSHDDKLGSSFRNEIEYNA